MDARVDDDDSGLLSAAARDAAPRLSRLLIGLSPDELKQVTAIYELSLKALVDSVVALDEMDIPVTDPSAYWMLLGEDCAS